MKTLSTKKLTIAAVTALVAVAAIIYALSSSGKKNVPVFTNPAFAAYINSYTAGMLPSNAALNVVFASDIVDSSQVGQEVVGNLFDFRPTIKGKAFWVTPRTVEFRPESRMKSGERYTVNLSLAKLLTDVPDDLRVFTFSFQIVPQNFEVVIDNVKPAGRTDFERILIEGNLNTADFADAVDVEKALTARQDGKTLDLLWTHVDEGKNHRFVVDGVARTAQAGRVELVVDGKPIGISRSERVNVDIPAKDEFKLMNVRVVQTPNQHVVLQFSDPLKEKQDLRGLVTISDLQSLDFDIQNNQIFVYPPVPQSGKRTLSIAAGIRNSLDTKLGRSANHDVSFEQLKPAVRFSGKGSILPSTNGLVVPFEAVNLRAVDVQILKVHESNVLQFLQVNNLDGRNEMRRVGNRLLKKRVPLTDARSSDAGKWNRYTLDISQFIQSEPGAIYEVKLSFRKSYSIYACADAGEELTPAFEEADESYDEGYVSDYSYDYYDDYFDYRYYGESFDWSQRDNPCHASYYTSNRAASRNILASDLGLTAKRGEDGNTLVFVTDLKTAKPLAGVEVSMYNFQLKNIGEGRSDSEGKVALSGKETPFAVVAKRGGERGYLRLVNGEALLVSNFNVSGEVVQKGLKGFLYGERGVWRPGDSLHLTFILEDKRKSIPSSHPVVFELSNPHGQVVNRIVRSGSENGFFRFSTATSSDAPTGNWTGRVRVGGTEFSRQLKIETVKPNRLKIDLNLGGDKLTAPEIEGTLDVRWLHGAPGRNLKAEFEVFLTAQRATFNSFPDYNFDDPSRDFESESQIVFEGKTNTEGRAVVSGKLELAGEPSGFLNAVFRGRVYEESGNFSVDRFSIPYYPYSSFVGMRVPEGERYSGILYTDQEHKIPVATVDYNGNPISRKGLSVNMYKMSWRWWWDNTGDYIANFMEGSHSRLVRSGTVNTVNGKGEWSFNLETAEYGRYFLRICDLVSGHCAGKVIYVDEPGWWSRARGDDARGGANLLSFSTDKTTYNIGERIQLSIPGNEHGRALVSIENGSKILQTHWVETGKDDTPFSLEASADMSPNAYIHVSLLQPHDQTLNDMPMRLYGVASVEVQDPRSHLEPVIAMADKLVPGEPVSIRVSEKSGRKMTFTVAMVDEGLLDLTRFKTPEPWKTFYAREALGVRTWDIFDHVVGAFGANLERFISIGGDGDLVTSEVDPLANRFKPVVKFFGPYTLNGNEREIRFTMPQYVGSVKTMVVAGYEGAYGQAEKVSVVKKPLMVLATLPRVLGPEEVVNLPVTLFTGETGRQDVKVSVAVKGPLVVKGAPTTSVRMSDNTDATVSFQLAVKPETGIGRVEVTATSGNFSSTDLIEIQVRNPNVPVTRVQSFLLEKSGRVDAVAKPFGISGTNTAVLEVSSLPPINLEARMRYLLRYPHGCLEQTVSAAFPQLYLSNVKALTEAESDLVQENVKTAIDRIRSFARTDGSFSYWPGAESYDAWTTSYTGHFLIEALDKGYHVAPDLLNRWKSFQRAQSNAWRRNNEYANSDLLQAYRLYTLALAGVPEMGAMNRLREEGSLSSTAAWMLAASYAVSGQGDAARRMTENLPVAVKPYREMGYSYGSHTRDRALIMETLMLIGDRARAFELLGEISESLGNADYWMSTQETAMCLRAAALFAGAERKGEMKFDYRINNGSTVNATTALPIAQVQVPVRGVEDQALSVINKTDGVLFARLIQTGTPSGGSELSESNGLSIRVNYTDIAGNTVDPSQLRQGTEFLAQVTIKHPGIRGRYENLALSQVFPPGWEITNLRLTDDESLAEGASGFSYQDIRDDRVYTYFDLNPHEEKTISVLLTATYAGDYYLAAVNCEPMYDPGVYARVKGRNVSVIAATP